MQAAMEDCAGVHGVASGLAFEGCVQGKMGELAASRDQEVLRNFSCAQDDTGSPVVKTVNVTVPVGYDACEAHNAGEEAESTHESVHPDYFYLPGVFIPAGNELSQATVTASKAAEMCSSMAGCEGFTFSAKSKDGPATVYFKTDTAGHDRGKDWHTYRRRQPPTCSATPPEEETRSYKVDVIREEPLVAMIRGFAAPGECEMLVAEAGDWSSMGRAYTSGGKHSQYRRSYSKNINPPLREADSELMRLVGRMFSVTRNLTGYKVYPPGQEPVNAVLYREVGDEYRPHCDGTCTGAHYKPGERIATSILYCNVAELGGQTSFTEGTHKVVPVQGDMLLFAYRYSDGRMTANEAEHSGCPIRRGQKWIATQWYREGVNENWNWQDVNHVLRDL